MLTRSSFIITKHGKEINLELKEMIDYWHIRLNI